MEIRVDAAFCVSTHLTPHSLMSASPRTSPPYYKPSKTGAWEIGLYVECQTEDRLCTMKDLDAFSYNKNGLLWLSYLTRVSIICLSHLMHTAFSPFFCILQLMVKVLGTVVLVWETGPIEFASVCSKDQRRSLLCV